MACFTKLLMTSLKNILKIENEHWIVDIGAAKLADSPEVFDVIVMPNLYGDILSDVAAQITWPGGLGRFGQYWRFCVDVRGHPWLGPASRRSGFGRTRQGYFQVRS
jgi:isocitrate dehydrogenase